MRLFLLVLLSLLLVSCTQKEQVPDAYGIFVEINGQWRSIQDGDMRLDLDSDSVVRILVHQKSIDLYMRSFELARKVYVRNIAQRDPDQPPRNFRPYNKWEKPKRYHVMKGQFYPVKGQQEMVLWTPVAPLLPGVYQVTVLGWTGVDIGVGQGSLAGSPEKNDQCVDLIQTRFGGIPMGLPDEYVSCAESEKAAGLLEAKRQLEAMVKQGGSVLPESGRGILREIMESEKDPNLLLYGNTLLSFAAQSDFVDLMEVLIARGADVNRGGEDGTPLHWAVASGKYAAAFF
jgi:Ankyrin repeat